MKFNVSLEPVEKGEYNVSVPALDGCFTKGEKEEEALQNAKEAILCYLTKAGLKEFICQHEKITSPGILRREVVDAGKLKGHADADLVDKISAMG
jgi:predicted RNase H-like HicB family nuclease